MSILVTGDLHLNDNPRDAYRHATIKRLITYVKTHKEIKCVIILGDLTDDKDRHGAWLVNRIVNYIGRLASICPVIINMGNHDYIDPEQPFFELLRWIENVTWISIPTLISLDELGPTIFLPHTRDYERDWRNILKKNYDSNLIFAHNTFHGARARGRVLDGIPTNVFPKNTHVISGDIHTPQKLGPVTYAGAPYTIDFGDDYTPRVLLIKKNNVQSMPWEGPQKRLCTVSSLEEFTKMLHDYSPGDIVKIRMHINNQDHDKWPQLQTTLRARAINAKLTVHSITPLLEQIRSSARRKRIIKTTHDPEMLIKNYATLQGVDAKTENVALRIVREIT